MAAFITVSGSTIILTAIEAEPGLKKENPQHRQLLWGPTDSVDISKELVLPSVIQGDRLYRMTVDWVDISILIIHGSNCECYSDHLQQRPSYLARALLW